MYKNTIYPFMIRDGAFQEMRNILRFPETTGPEIDGQICRVIVPTYSINQTLKKEYIDRYKNDNVSQIRLLGNNEKEFLVMASMLSHLNEAVIEYNAP